MPTLTPSEICDYFDTMPDGRRDLVWLRIERLLGAPLDDYEPDDERVESAFDEVITDMWCADQMSKLVALGRLQQTVGADGRLMHHSV